MDYMNSSKDADTCEGNVSQFSCVDLKLKHQKTNFEILLLRGKLGISKSVVVISNKSKSSFNCKVDCTLERW